MKKSSKPILSHIPRFLDYCRKIGLSEKTYENYKHYLKKFLLWLKKENKNTLLPHKLTTDDIRAYRLYLSRYTNEKGRPLKKVTQNYYLIALRALLSYFTVKDIESPPIAKIELLGGIKSEKTVKFLNLEQIERLLLAPNTKKPIGLRDRAILEILISTGFKISQLTKLNRDKLVEDTNLSEKAFFWIKKYLETRKDKNNALFINYKARRKSIGDRLTARSIERIVKYYGKKIGLPFFINPEILRWARAHALVNKEIKIQNPQNHQTLEINNYKKSPVISPIRYKTTKKLSPTWNDIENIINNEIIWLKENIPVLSEVYKKNPPFLKHDDIILRKIAILITSGKVKALELKPKGNKDLWDSLTEKSDLEKISYHGKEWHKKMMDVIYKYFKLQNYKIILEPILNYGRADLGVYSGSNKPLYIEVGTVSLYKLWYNLSTMKNVSFLIVPSENNVIEFKV